MTKSRGRLALIVPPPIKSVDTDGSASLRGLLVDEEDRMIYRIAVTVIVSLVLMVATAWPLTMYQHANVNDAVQDVLIQKQEQEIRNLRETVRQMDSKINYMLGGIAGIYGIIAIVGVLNALILKNKRS